VVAVARWSMLMIELLPPKDTPLLLCVTCVCVCMWMMTCGSSKKTRMSLLPEASVPVDVLCVNVLERVERLDKRACKGLHHQQPKTILRSSLSSSSSSSITREEGSTCVYVCVYVFFFPPLCLFSFLPCRHIFVCLSPSH
jgi:hypothetical protein